MNLTLTTVAVLVNVRHFEVGVKKSPGAGDLSGYDHAWAGLLWPEPVLRIHAFYLRTDWLNRPDLVPMKADQPETEPNSLFVFFIFISRQ